MGRRTKLLNPVVRNTILKHISNGTPIKYACMAAGIDESTYYIWQQRAEQGNPNNGDKIYFNFFKELKIAEAENIAHNVDNIQSAADNDNRNWMASAWLMERKYPADFGKRMELEVGPSKVLIAIQEQAQKLMQGQGQVIEGETKLIKTEDKV